LISRSSIVSHDYDNCHDNSALHERVNKTREVAVNTISNENLTIQAVKFADAVNNVREHFFQDLCYHFLQRKI